jgi:hypothetical protein
MLVKIGLGIVTLLSMFVVSIAPALAAPEFEAESKWSAEGHEQLAKLGGTLSGKCGTAKFEGVSPLGKRSLTALMKPKYTECKVSLGGAAVVNTFECEYELHNLKGESTYEAEANLVNCKQGITAKILLCLIVIPEQKSLKAGKGSNIKTTKGSFESKATANLEGFKATAKGCLLAENVEGSYTGEGIAKGLIAL